MTVEEKRKALSAFCAGYKRCDECPLKKWREDNGIACNFLEVDGVPLLGDGVIEDYYAAVISDATPHIKDSGERREFETGAVRDIQEGKGRCDLLPLDVLAECYSIVCPGDGAAGVFGNLYRYTQTGEFEHLCRVLEAAKPFEGWADMFLAVAKHFEEGAKKYGEYNWQKGIPAHCYIDSAVRHYLKWLRGDVDEPHDRAFCWNILCCIWTCIHKPELNEYWKEQA